MHERTECVIVVGAAVKTADADVGAVSDRRQVNVVVVDVVGKLMVAQVLGFGKPGPEPEQRRLPDVAEVSQTLGPDAWGPFGHPEKQRSGPLRMLNQLVLLRRPEIKKTSLVVSYDQEL